MKASIDPVFALVDATQEPGRAQAGGQRTDQFGFGEHAFLPRRRFGLWLTKSRDAREAELELEAAGGLTREEFEKQRIAMGLSAEQAQVLIDKYDLIFTP